MIVVDASALVEVLLGRSSAVLTRWLYDPALTLHAPHLLDMEVAQVTRRYAARGEIDGARGAAMLAALAALPIQRHAQTRMLGRIWELRHNVTAYDAAYVALAELLDAPLLTLDRRLAMAAAHRARVILA